MWRWRAKACPSTCEAAQGPGRGGAGPTWRDELYPCVGDASTVLSQLQHFEANAHPLRGGMKPTAGETVLMSALVGYDAESEARIRTPRGGK
jgi:hypothetical protein